MENKTKGAWLIHHTQKLRSFENPLDYENIYTAGRAGLLLSGLAASEQATLTSSDLDAIRKAAGIPKSELAGLLKPLEAAGLVQTGANEVEVLGLTTHATLEHTATVYESLQPTSRENAAISFADLTTNLPMGTAQAREVLGDTFKLSNSETTELILQSEEFGFVDAEDVGSDRKLYFNGNIFRRESAKKIAAVVESLSPEDQQCPQSLLITA